jgi:hypothetical protein
MGSYTTVLISFSPLESKEDRITEIEGFSHQGQIKKWFDFHNEPFPNIFRAYTIGAVYKELEIEDFLHHLQTNVMWNNPEYVQIYCWLPAHWTASLYINAGKDLVYLGIPE